MAKNKSNRSERRRKFIVSLKKKPQMIPFVFMLITFVVYSFNLTKISNTTATINREYMGLCEFVIMLGSILSFVCFLNSFPSRQKPKKPMLALLFILQAVIAFCDFFYVGKINEGISAIKLTKKTYFIVEAQQILTVHAILVIVSIILIALVPVLKKQLAKINTSVKLAENEGISNIELSEGE